MHIVRKGTGELCKNTIPKCNENFRQNIIRILEIGEKNSDMANVNI